MDANLYLRVSTDEQAEEGFSLDAQERLCRLSAELRGCDVVRVYRDDGYTGRTLDRPALQQLRKDVLTQKPAVIIVHKIDRLARDLELMLGMVNEWDRRGIAFVSVVEQVDFSTPMGRMVLQMLGAVAEWYSNNLSAETKKGLAEKAKQGYWVGSVPYGYTLKDGVLIVNEGERPVIQEVYELYASGSYSYSQIAQLLNQRGLMIMDWLRRGRHPFGEYSVRSILDSRAYLGLVASNDVEYPGKHEAIIDRALWDRVVAVREQRSRKGRISTMTGSFVQASPLNGLVYCVQCGSTMHWHPKKKTHCYYRCGGIRAQICDAKRMANFEQLHETVQHQLQALAIPTDYHERIISFVEELTARQERLPAVDRTSIESRLKRLARVYADGHLDDATYERERAELLSLLRPDLAPVARPTPSSDMRHLLMLLSQVPALYQSALPAERAALLRKLFAKFWIEDGRLKALTPTPLFMQIVGAWGYMATPGRASPPMYPLLPVWSARHEPWQARV